MVLLAYVMSGTELAYRAIGLRACYAMSITEIAYATRCPVRRRAPTAQSGEVRYHPTRVNLRVSTESYHPTRICYPST
eukprot:2358474-Rhodomonas_salina.5